MAPLAMNQVSTIYAQSNVLMKDHTPKLTVENPYKLKMVPFKDVANDYYTMSANGITHIRADGYSGQSLDLVQ